MRITNSMMVSQFLSDANGSLSRVSKYQDEVDSTKRVSRISDDPQATITALKARNKLSDLDAYQSNIETAKSYLAEAESAADELGDILQTAYEEVVSATGGGKTQDDLDVIAQELTSLQQEIVSIGNSKVGTSFVFGGYNFTGTTDGVTTTAPFSIEETTGHLIYNGIDLSRVFWSEDYDKNTALMTSSAETVSAKTAALGTTSSDEYARDTLCADALNALNDLVAAGEASLGAAEAFEVDPSGSAYQELYQLVYGVGEEGDADYTAGLSDLAEDLYNECSKDLAGDYILEGDCTQMTADGAIDYDYYEERGITVMTPEEYDNCFGIGDAQDILDAVMELVDNSSATAGFDYSMDEAVSGVRSAMDADPAYAGASAALADEEDNQAVLQIGTTQTVAFTFPGTDLVGAGSENAYLLVGKCISMLQAGDMESLSDMISELQDAQSNALCFQTEIGTTENRLSLISSRYDSSEINYTEMQSNAVDADMAEAIVNLTTAQTVYSAALAGGAEIIQTSLIDFLT